MSFLFPASTITLDAALRDVASGSPKARVAAAHALGDVSDPAAKRRAVDALVRALDDDRGEVRGEACSSLAALAAPSGAVIAGLVKRLDDGEAGVRQNAAIALGTLAHPDGFDPLAEALASGPPDLRFQAATSLAEIDAARAFAPIAAALADRDPQVVGAAALALGAIGDARAIALLVEQLEHRDPGTRFDVGYALAELHDARGLELLVANLTDADRAWDAVQAIAMIATTIAGVDRDRAISALAGALATKQVPAEATVLAAGKLLALAPDDPSSAAARRVLVAALAARKGHIRALAVEQLGLARAAWARPHLDKLARSSKGADLLEAIAKAYRQIDGTDTPEDAP